MGNTKKQHSKRPSRKQKNKRPSHVRTHFAFLEYLRSITPRRQKVLIKGADLPILQALSEIALNLIKKNIHLKPHEIAKLRPYEEDIYQLALKRNSVAKKKLIIQRGGFLSALVTTVLPALLSTILAIC